MIPLIPLPGTPLGNRSTLTQTTMDRLRQQGYTFPRCGIAAAAAPMRQDCWAVTIFPPWKWGGVI